MISIEFYESDIEWLLEQIDSHFYHCQRMFDPSTRDYEIITKLLTTLDHPYRFETHALRTHFYGEDEE
jgi:hypothetical protein